MKILIESPDGPRPGAMPADGIHDAAVLVKSLLVTLACECAGGQARTVLDIALDGFDANALIEIARFVGRSPECAGDGMATQALSEK